ncbi:hypothetical protein [Flavobacterium sp.]|uniref:hypothetical protein n=1 Tax=Flavobacterium sp. TaxID=239 RepID=UPI00403453C8
MKKKRPKNKFDALVEKLIAEFSKIRDFDLMMKDEVGKKIFNIIIYRTAEIVSYKELVCQHFIPETNKALVKSKQDFNTSQYRFLLNTEGLDFKETLHDTIRLAYVGLFHKFENYRNDVLEMPQLIFGNLYNSDQPIALWAKEKFDFDIKDLYKFHITHKINWICNCVKHKDGLPTKTPKPSGFQFLDESKRIVITPEEFKKDAQALIEFYPFYLQLVLTFAQHKMCVEMVSPKEEIFGEEIRQELLNKVASIEALIRKYIADQEVKEKTNMIDIEIKGLTSHILNKLKELR